MEKGYIQTLLEAEAILAESFARIFYRNAINLGLPAITCTGISNFFRQGDAVEIDFETGIITNHTTGKTIHSEPVGDYMMNILKSGGIKPMIRAQL